MLKINTNYAIEKKELEKHKSKIEKIHKMIHEKTGLGKDFLGWVEWPNNYDKKELEEMKKIANKLKNKIKYLIVIGIGGSYLGSRAALDMINGLYPKNNNIEVIYMGHTMSSTYTKQVLEYLNNKKYGICVISKSGTTLEPAIAFRLLSNHLIKQVGEKNAKDLIVCITDKEKGALKGTANNKGYETFIIPDDIGGRYSVLTPVGVFVMLVLNINVDNIFIGAKKAYKDLLKLNNSAYEYALTRYILHKEKKYNVEMISTYEIQMQYYLKWWEQLFGESEGKENKGLLPVSAIFSTDLHSLGQFIQEGSKCLFETIIKINKNTNDVKMINDKDNLDGLNYLNNKSLNEINYIAQKGVIEAHKQTGKVPNIIIEFDSMNDITYGYSVYWFFKACAMSAYLLEINPFNQPGVEIYKKNMFKLLEKK